MTRFRYATQERRSKSKGGPDSGTYQQSARTALARWQEWLAADAVEQFGDPDDGGRVMRRYAQHLTERIARDVNAKGMFLCARAAIPYLKDGGSIINTASIAGEIGAAGIAHYAASKHAVMALTKTLALELAEDDVTDNAICPGIVDTPMWRDVLTPASEESYDETIQRSIPLHRDQKPEDMGRLAVFFAEKRNITDEAVKVDGGITQDVL